MLQERGIGYGIVYNAGRVNGHVSNTDAGWIASAKANTLDWGATVHAKPNKVVIQTWSSTPVRIVPENDPTTMTGDLKWSIDR